MSTPTPGKKFLVGMDDAGSGGKGSLVGYAYACVETELASAFNDAFDEMKDRLDGKALHGCEFNPRHESKYRMALQFTKDWLGPFGGAAGFELLDRRQQMRFEDPIRQRLRALFEALERKDLHRIRMISRYLTALHWLLLGTTRIASLAERIDVFMESNDASDTQEMAQQILLPGTGMHGLIRVDDGALMMFRSLVKQPDLEANDDQALPSVESLRVVPPRSRSLSICADLIANFALAFLRETVRSVTGGPPSKRGERKARVFTDVFGDDGLTDVDLASFALKDDNSIVWRATSPCRISLNLVGE